MTRVSIELVPRDTECLLSELEILKNSFSEVDTINIPDLSRYEIRSWEGCGIAKTYYSARIPHIRAIDVNMNEPLPMADYIMEHNISEVLVVTGDPPQDMSRKIYPSTCVEIIRKFKQELPMVKVYAGIDQYRHSIKKEIEYAKRKIYAGADGFFTQPFFDVRYLEIYAELLLDTEVFWGVSPVGSERSVSYWEAKNNVVFPADFKPTLEWNLQFARQTLRFARESQSNIYFMPIKTNVHEYLQGVFY